MDKKYKQILLLLLNREYIQVEEISITLKKTNRSVRNYMKELSTLLYTHGATIVTVYKKGYHLQIFDEEKFNDFAVSFQNRNHDYNIAENRIVEMFSRLLFEDHFIKQEEFMEDFCISNKQLNEDMNIIKKFLNRFSLTISAKPYYGMKVLGQEYDKRLCISSFHIVYGENFYDSQIENYASLKESIKNIVVSCIIHKNYEISDNNLESLISHIALAIIRVLHHQCVNKDEVVLESFHSLQYSIALDIAHMIDKILEITLTQEEIQYITIQLLSKENKVFNQDQQISQDMQELIEAMFKHIQKHLKIELFHDFDLWISLAQHFIPLMERIKYKTFVHNPLMQEIKVKLCQSYEMAIVACEVINEKYHIVLPEEEIAFLALHIDLAYKKKISSQKNILIVCSSGLATARLLKDSFTKRFSHCLNRIDVMSSLQLTQCDLSIYDCIFTTVPLHIESSIPIMKIENIVLDEDFNKISHQLNHIPNWIQYFHESLFITDYSYENKDMCIHDLIDRASCYYDISSQFESLVLKREELGSTEFGSLIALPHAIYPVNEKTFVVVAICRRPLLWNQHKVRIIMLLSVSQTCGQDELDAFYHMMTMILSHKILQSQILRCKDYSQFLNCLGDYL